MVQVYYLLATVDGSRRLTHVNVTANPAGEWTLQQLREAITEGRHRHLIHDRDRIYSSQLDNSIEALGLKVLRSPIASPKPIRSANA
jgi:hypothetical protein